MQKMSWLKKVFSSQSLQETKVVCEVPKNESQDKKFDDPQISDLKIKEEENKEESTQETSQETLSSWFSS